MYHVSRHAAFVDWFQLQKLKVKSQIDSRLVRILNYGHFGDSKKVGPFLSELKWRSGLRVYFTIVNEEDGRLLILLLGGNKNSQGKDIAKSNRLINEIRSKEIQNEEV